MTWKPDELRLHNDHWDITVLPGVGCKIASLRGVRSGREWLWSNPHLPVVPPEYGGSYVGQMDSGGWDEVFPSVSPVEMDGLKVPDHGDLVALPWEVTEHSETVLSAFVRTRFAACRFGRVLRLVGNRLRMEYLLENEGPRQVRYLWCAHPLIRIERGMRIELPKGTSMHVIGGSGFPETKGFLWPELGGLKPLDVIPDPEAEGFQPFAVKTFTSRGSVDGIRIASPDGREGLVFDWDRRDVPFLGLWLNSGAWSGCGSTPYFNLGIEPTTAPHDSLEDAVSDGTAIVLEPQATRRWSLSIELY
jgi:hypothetical protein